MKRIFVTSLGAIAMIVFAMAVQPVACAQSSSDASAIIALQVTEQTQHEVQAELARAQAELARAMDEVNQKVRVKVNRELAARLAAQRGALLSNLSSLKAELAAMEQERSTQRVSPLIEVQESESGWLGVQISDVDADKVKELKLPAERGVLITEVEKDSPADKAGLKVNDVVTEYNGQRVESTTQFRRMVRESLAGRPAQLNVWREGRSQSLSVTLGSSSDRVERSFRVLSPREFNYSGNLFNFDMPNIYIGSRTPLLGINAEDLSGQLGTYFGAPGGEGILVREVNSGSPAEKAGMKAGDVITKVNGEAVKNLEQLREKLRAKREGKTVSIGVIRKGSETSLNVEVEQPRPPERRRIARRTSL